MKDERHVAALDDVLASGLWINGGYFIFRPEIFDHIRARRGAGGGAISRLAAADRLIAYRYEGFWAPLDTLKDMLALEEAQDTGRPPWAPWLQGSA